MAPSTVRDRIMAALLLPLRIYTKYSPFRRGRGLFIRPIEALKRRGWPAPVVLVGDRLQMEFEPSLIGWTCFERGTWEPEQTAIISDSLSPGAIVLNVGANTGYYALLAGSLVAPQGHVHAFEIQPAIIEILRRNVARNNLQDVVTIVTAGCFSSERDATIHCPGDPGSASVAFNESGVRVRLTTVDHYAAINGLSRVDLLLIDTEGADFEVLKGAATVLTRFRPMVVAEAHLLARFGSSEDEMITFMSQYGYSVAALNSEFSRDLLFLPPKA